MVKVCSIDPAVVGFRVRVSINDNIDRIRVRVDDSMMVNNVMARLMISIAGWGVCEYVYYTLYLTLPRKGRVHGISENTSIYKVVELVGFV